MEKVMYRFRGKITKDAKEIIEIEMPADAKIVHVDDKEMDLRYFDLWAICNAEEKTRKKRLFICIPTGFPFPEDAKYIGTYSTGNKRLYIHIFELT